MKLVDAYSHVSLPRFLSVEELLAVLDQNGVESAVAATAETCPDLPELSRAAVEHGDRLRAVGMPSGESAEEMRECIAEQMAAGFLGIRLPAGLVAEHPELLDEVGRAGGVPFVVGSSGLAVAADALVGFLERYPECLVCAPHFAGVAEPELLRRDPAVRALFAQPRFLVIFSRQGAQDQRLVRPWTRAVVKTVGWERVMWGSEYPVALWRDETYLGTQRWFDFLDPSPTEREAFFSANAASRLFSRPLRPARRIGERWAAERWRRSAPVWLFPSQSLDLPEAAHRRILEAYLRAGGDQRGSYREFVADLLN